MTLPLKRTILLFTFVSMSACGPSEPESEEMVEQTAPALTNLTTADFGQLRWIEGRWVGMAGGNPFFEGYRFANDSTLRSYSFADSASAVPTDSGTIALRGGRIVDDGESGQWVASELTPTRINFVPEAGVTNSFAWERRSADEWVATLTSPATGNGEATETVYEMRRLAEPAAAPQ